MPRESGGPGPAPKRPKMETLEPASTGPEIINKIRTGDNPKEVKKCDPGTETDSDPGDEEEDAMDEAIGLRGLNRLMKKVGHKEITEMKKMLTRNGRKDPVDKVSGLQNRFMLREADLAVETGAMAMKGLRASRARVRKVIGKGRIGRRGRKILNVYETAIEKVTIANRILDRTHSLLTEMTNSYQVRAAVIGTRFHRRAGVLRKEAREEAKKKKKKAAEAVGNQQPKSA